MDGNVQRRNPYGGLSNPGWKEEDPQVHRPRRKEGQLLLGLQARGLLPALMLGGALLAGTAQAGTPVLHSGPWADVAARKAASLTGLAPDEMDPLTIADLAGNRSLVAWPGSLEPCTGEAARTSQVSDAADRAVGHLNYGRYAEARDTLTRAAVSLGCLMEIASPDSTSKVFYLHGIVHALEESPADAQRAFTQALVIHPTLTWDESYPPEFGQSLFEAAAVALAQEAPAEVLVSPRYSAQQVRIDGRQLRLDAPSMDVAPGRHLVQVGGSAPDTFWLQVTPGDSANVLLRSEFPDSATDWVRQPDRAPELSALLAHRFGPGTQVFVLPGDGSAWKGNAGEGGFLQVVASTMEHVKEHHDKIHGRTEPETGPPVTKSEKPFRLRKDPHDYTEAYSGRTDPSDRFDDMGPAEFTTLIGVAAFLQGTIWGAKTLKTVRDLDQECRGGTDDELSACEANGSASNTQKSRLPIAAGIAIGGVVVAEAGWMWGGQSAGVAVEPWGNGRGVALTVRR